ncbi:MAG: GTPase HflX, partial [Curtobacterium sp.]
VGEADVIVHVVDGSHPDPAAQLATVRDVIGDVGARDIPEIVAFNKSDLIDDAQRLVLVGLAPDAVFVSARTGEGIPELLRAIEARLPEPDVELTVVIPYERGDLVSSLHDAGAVESVDYVEAGTRLRVRVFQRQVAELDPFVVAPVTTA